MKYPCPIINDLLPLYADGVCSEESRQAVMEHLKDCACCRKEYEKMEQYAYNLQRAAVELAQEWRSDKAMRRLEAMMIVADAESMLIVSGTGEVIESDDGVCAIGSGGNYALAAARALVRHTELSAHAIAEEALRVASSICVYTNDHITVEDI